jgi:hypothetical protein
MIESVLPAVTATLELMHTITPAPQTATALHALTSNTTDLIGSLSTLSDTVHMNRQTSLVAGRRLRSVKDALREWSTEWDVRDNGVQWIERGCWNQRLQNRECAGVCQEVLSGFEQVCDQWRDRLLAGASGESVAGASA